MSAADGRRADFGRGADGMRDSAGGRGAESWRGADFGRGAGEIGNAGAGRGADGMRGGGLGAEAYGLPVTVEVAGVRVPIRTDFRAVLDVLAAASDPLLDDGARAAVMLVIMFPNWRSLPRERVGDALLAARDFIDRGSVGRGGSGTVRLFDWREDAGLIVPAVNRVAGFDVRAAEYLHWWTFLSYFFEIGDSLFGAVLRVRKKRAAGKKLDDAEAEFFRENRELFDPPPRDGGDDGEAAVLRWL